MAEYDRVLLFYDLKQIKHQLSSTDFQYTSYIYHFTLSLTCQNISTKMMQHEWHFTVSLKPNLANLLPILLQARLSLPATPEQTSDLHPLSYQQLLSSFSLKLDWCLMVQCLGA